MEKETERLLSIAALIIGGLFTAQSGFGVLSLLNNPLSDLVDSNVKSTLYLSFIFWGLLFDWGLRKTKIVKTDIAIYKRIINMFSLSIKNNKKDEKKDGDYFG